MKTTFQMEKPTKNTIRFAEVLENPDTDAAMIGTIYIPKSTLSAIGWKEGMTLEVSLEAK